LPELPASQSAPLRMLSDKPVSEAERKQLAGTFVLKLQLGPNLFDSFAQYRRTYRVFDENGRLMIEPLGEAPQRLLKQEDRSFAMRSSPASQVSFVMENGRAVAIKLSSQNFFLAGDRVGDGDVKTFHQQFG
jgi:hypothetical protein